MTIKSVKDRILDEKEAYSKKIRQDKKTFKQQENKKIYNDAVAINKKINKLKNEKQISTLNFYDFINKKRIDYLDELELLRINYLNEIHDDNKKKNLKKLWII